MQTDQLVQQIKSRFDHNQAKAVLKESQASKMLFTYNGGMWNAGPELATQCNLCLANGHPSPVFEDIYGTPVKVDADELKTLTIQRWQEQMNAWLVEYEQLCNQR